MWAALHPAVPRPRHGPALGRAGHVLSSWDGEPPFLQRTDLPGREEKVGTWVPHPLSVSANPGSPHSQAASQCRLREEAACSGPAAADACSRLCLSVCSRRAPEPESARPPRALRGPRAHCVFCFSSSPRLSAVPGLQRLLHLLLSKSPTPCPLPPEPPLGERAGIRGWEAPRAWRLGRWAPPWSLRPHRQFLSSSGLFGPLL